MITVHIVEDEKASANHLIEYLVRFGKEINETFQIKVYNDGLDFLNDYHGADLVFMDIEMPYIDGLETARKLREKDDSVILIFITNMAHLAIKGYSVSAMNFIVKPIAYTDLCYNMKKVISILSRSNKNTILLNCSKGPVVLCGDDIYYLEVVKHNVNYHTVSGVYAVRQSLLEAEEMLGQSEKFVRPYNAFLVNLNYVEKIKEDGVIVKGDWIPFSRGKKKEFMDALTLFIGSGGKKC